MTDILDGISHADDSPSMRQRPRATTSSSPTIDDLTVLPSGSAAWFTVVIPSRNEVDSVAPLLERLGRSLPHPERVEVLFVDDSDDGTPAEVQACAYTSGLAVRLLHRSPDDRVGGLAGAVTAGLKAARGTWAVVMDGDLQHPPEIASELVRVGMQRDLDLVVGTRHLGGAAEGLASRSRHLTAAGARAAAHALFPSRLAALSDPMSGLFAVRLSALDGDRLNPVGFKILMEIAVRHPNLRVAEVPFTFGDREHGQSKASWKEGARFVRHLARLRTARGTRGAAGTSGKSRRIIKFGLVGVSGIAVNEAALWALGRETSLHYLWAAVGATVASTAWNLLLTETVVFRGDKPGSLRSRAVRFVSLNVGTQVLRLPLLALLVSGVSMPVLIANLLTIGAVFLIRFWFADRAIYGVEKPKNGVHRAPGTGNHTANHTGAPKALGAPDVSVTGSQTATLQSAGMPSVVLLTSGQNATALQSATRSKDSVKVVVHTASTPPAVLTRPPATAAGRYLSYRYSIPGVATVGSQVVLPELEYFRDQTLGQSVDISIRVGEPARKAMRKRVTLTQHHNPVGVRYEEQLRRFGANFSVEIGDTIQVVASASLARSPHVLYTNVLEALLRFVAVSNGVILLHSACMELGGKGILLSARTDTGKTGTVLRLLREFDARFLSDDMTILGPDGQARCFPKPLTISHHTLRAVAAGDLTAAEWRRLKLQSRLHSKEGRAFGMLLAKLNIPIMGANALTQRIVPPPKYIVDRLVACSTISTTQVRELYVIERGTPRLADLDPAAALTTLIENTDDAYGFPPFRHLAPSIVIGGSDYATLRVSEMEILRRALTTFPVQSLASDTFGWADEIARMQGVSAAVVPTTPSGPLLEQSA